MQIFPGYTTHFFRGRGVALPRCELLVWKARPGETMIQSNRPTTDETLTAFLRTMRGANKSEATITAYRTDLSQFASFLAETNCTIGTPADISRGDIAEYLAHLGERGMSGKTRARKL